MVSRTRLTSLLAGGPLNPEQANTHALAQSRLPNLTDMSAETITSNVHAINSLCENPRSVQSHTLFP